MPNEQDSKAVGQCDECGGPVVSTGTGYKCDECDQRYPRYRCWCDDPTVTRTLAKGTPAEKEYCQCGGRVR